MSVCYDLRFPELYRILALRGAEVLAVPSAFTTATGRDHWEVLLRARAIENQAFVLAPNQFGTAPPHYDSFGHSMIVDPWGRVLALAPEGEGFLAADLDLASWSGCARRCPRSPTAARRPTPGRSRARPGHEPRRPAMASKAPPVDKRPADPRRRGARVRASGIPRDPGRRHRRRGRRRLRPRLPLLPLQGRGDERTLHRALVAAAGGDRGGRPRRRQPPRASSPTSPASSSTPTATTPS